MDSARDVISHQAVANVLNGKNFPAWPKAEVLVSALLFLANVEVTKTEMDAFRRLWLSAHYNDDGSAPSVELRSSLLESDLYALSSQFDLDSQVAPGSGDGPSGPADAGDEEPALEDLYVRFIASPSSGPAMFSVEHRDGMLHVMVNTGHPMGASISKVMEDGDEEASRLLKILLVSWARMEDETPTERGRNRLAEVRRDWSRYAQWLEAPEG